MSWHCAFCGSPDNWVGDKEKKNPAWIHAHLAPLHGDVPICVVFHAECFKKVIARDADNIKDTMDMWIAEAKDDKRV